MALTSIERIERRARRWRQFLLGLLIVATVMCGAAFGACVKDDAEIAAHRGRAIATVDMVGPLRTLVTFQDGAGTYRTPRRGLIYPGGLAPGQRVWVEYATSNPDLVRVQGRTWRLAVWPVLSVWLTISALCIAAWLLVNRLERRRLRFYPESRGDHPRGGDA